jgi:hypothetical protein
MSAVQSEFLNQRQLNALERLGDLLLPGGEGFPTFSATGCLAHVDELLAATPAQDLRDLRLLLTLLSVFPGGLLKALLNMIEARERFPNSIAAPLRLLNLGLKGIIFSLYYSGLTGPYIPSHDADVHGAMAYELRCEADAVTPTHRSST